MLKRLMSRLSKPRDNAVLRGKTAALDLLASKGFEATIVIDVGAYSETAGLYATWPDAHFVMIEPVGLHEPALAALCSRRRSAEYLIAAAGSEEGTLRIAADPARPLTTRPWDVAPPEWPRFSVPIVTVDSLIDRVRRDHPGNALIKIDVDGPELDVLAGCARVLAEGRDAFLIEATLLDSDRARFGQIVCFMAQHGFEVFDIVEPLNRPSDDMLWQVDLLFVPQGFAGRAERRYWTD